jgi:exosome complex RNA-binding protein Rrp4
MKKYRRLEARKRVDEVHNQAYIVDINHQLHTLSQQLEILEKEFSSYNQSAQQQHSIKDFMALS